MYNRFCFVGGENTAIGKMFASPATTVETILSTKGISAYLQSFADPSSTPTSVISFVEREMPALLDYAQQSNPSFSASGSLRSYNDAFNNSQSDSTRRPTPPSPPSLESPLSVPLAAAGNNVVADSSTDGGVVEPLLTAPGSSYLLPVRSSSSASQNAQVASDSSRPLLNGITGVTTIIRHPRHRQSGASADSTGRLSSGSEADESGRNSGSLHSTRSRLVNKTLASINATELLAAYISSTRSAKALQKIVPVSFVMLASPTVENTALAVSVQRLLLAAFGADFVVTTNIINDILTPEIVAGCVRNLCRSSTVVETIIALFGSALSANIMMAPTTVTTIFTSGWIQNKFVDHLAAALDTVLHDPSMYNYFYLVKELLKRGFSHSAGPVVDIFLSYEQLSRFVEQALRVAEESPVSVSVDATLRCDPTHHLAGEALATWSYAVGMLRKSLPVTETPEMYACTCANVSPVRLVQQNAERLVAVLRVDLPNPVTRSECLPLVPPVTPCQYAGLVRVSICTLFVELGHYQVAECDAIVVESGFLTAFADVCRAFPRNDTLARLLHTFVLTIFARQPLHNETFAEALERDRILTHIASREGAAEGDGLISRLVAFAKDDALRTVSLSTFAMDALTKIAATSWCAETSSAALFAAVQPFLEDDDAQGRLHDIVEPITGANFKMPGAAALPAVVHHPTLNFATSQVSRPLSLSASVEDTTTGILQGDSTDGTNTISSSANNEGSQACATASAPSSSGSGSPLAGTAIASEARPYAVVPFVSAVRHEEFIPVEINIEDVHRETQALKDSGSAQLQAYPNFASMRLCFGSEDADSSPAPTIEHAVVSEAVAPSTGTPATAQTPGSVQGSGSSGCHPPSSESAGALPAANAAATVPVVTHHAPVAHGAPNVSRPPPVRKKMPPGLMADGKANS